MYPSIAIVALLSLISRETTALEWPLHIITRQSLIQPGTTDLYIYDLATQNATLLYNFTGDKSKRVIAADLKSNTLCYGTSTGIQCHQNGKTLPELNMAFGVLLSKDQTPVPFHMQLSPGGSQLMYLEPQRGGIWVHSLRTNTGILVHLQGQRKRIADFSCDWFNGMLFVLQFDTSSLTTSLSAWSLNGEKMTTEAWPTPIEIPDGQGRGGSVTCDPVKKLVYWATSSGSIYYAPYDKNPRETGQDLEDDLCKSYRRSGTQVPLIYNKNSLYCVSKNVNGSLFFLSLDLDRPGQDPISSLLLTLPGSEQFEQQKTGSIEALGMFRDWSHVQKFNDFVQQCQRCSHLCLPKLTKLNEAASIVSYECACPFDLELLNGVKCASPYRLAVAVETEDSERSKTFFYDYAEQEFKAWLQSNNSNFKFVPSEDSKLLCFQNGPGLECSDLETNQTFAVPWTQPSNMQTVHLVSRKFELGASSGPTQWSVYWTDQAGCSRHFSSSRNTSFAFYCFAEMDASSIAIDPRNWQLIYTHKTDSSINLVDILELKTTHLGNQTSAFKGLSSRNTVNPPLGQAYYFEGFNVLGITNFAGGSSKYHLGFNGSHHSLVYGKDNRLWWVESNTVYSMDLRSMAGIEVVMKVPPGTKILGLRHLKVHPGTTKEEVPAEDICAKSQCSEFCKTAADGKPFCWCPYEVPLELNATHCEPFRFLMVLKNAKGNLTTVNVSTDDSKEIPVLNLNLKTPHGSTFLDYNAGLQRSCWLRSGQVHCSRKGKTDAKIKTSATKVTPVVPSLAHGDHILWLSIEKSSEAKVAEALACFTILSPQRAKLLRATCVEVTAGVEIQFPVLDLLNRVLFWYVPNQGVYATIWRDTAANLVIRPRTPVRGLAVNNDSLQLFVLTDTSIRSYSYQVVPNSKRVDPVLKNTWNFGEAHSTTSSLRLFKRYLVYHVLDKFNRSSIEAFGPVNQPPQGPFTMYTAANGTSIQSFHVDLESPDPSGFYNACAPLACDFFCFPKESDDKPQCLCPGTEEPTPGKNYTDCNGLNPWWIIAPLIFGIILIIAGINIYVWIILKNRQNRSLQAAVTSFMEGNSTRAQSAKNNAEMALYVPFTAIIPSAELNTDYSRLLGEGNFGTVCQGKYQGQTVAVKTVKNNLDPQLTTDFLKELKIMAYVGDHPNIIKFHGAEISGIRQGKVHVVLELCRQGCLETYLRSYDGSKCVTFKLGQQQQETPFTAAMMYSNVESTSRTSSQPGILRSSSKGGAAAPDGTYINEGAVKRLSRNLSTSKEYAPLKLFYRWSYQIADAMDFLERKNVVHGDLATRNILMYDDDVVKVSDFGFSRNMYSYSTYQKKTVCPLPWRWASPETLSKLEFSFKADVWSFGVTLWEIFTFGNVPYPDQTWDLEFVNKIQQGMKLPQPKFMGKEMYQQVLLACWELEPSKRIAFGQLKEILAKYV